MGRDQATQGMIDAEPHGRMDLQPVQFGGVDPADQTRLAGGPQLAADGLGAEADRELLPDLAIVIGNDMARIGVARSAPLLQFGAGPHHCLGAALARLEIAEALPVLASRLPPPSIDGPVTWRPQVGIYGPNELPVRFG